MAHRLAVTANRGYLRRCDAGGLHCASNGTCIGLHDLVDGKCAAFDRYVASLQGHEESAEE